MFIFSKFEQLIRIVKHDLYIKITTFQQNVIDFNDSFQKLDIDNQIEYNTKIYKKNLIKNHTII